MCGIYLLVMVIIMIVNAERIPSVFGYAVLCAAIYGITNIIVDFIWSTVELVVLGSSWSAALAAEITSIPATIINAGFTVVGIAILYVPVKKAYQRILGA